eukprot:TRINITY_DN0_c397_g1_i9.p1 TRINITY_DN0_c397_g1~~TRINITY_DN0_c397_g1_i9.p1  ORF type:complete len:271 (+),score=46.83 TRINITY_DN0_c397_g1_i9:67-879(+)
MDVRFTSSPASSPTLTWRSAHVPLFQHRRENTPPLLKKLILSKPNNVGHKFSVDIDYNDTTEDEIYENIQKASIFKTVITGNRMHKRSFDTVNKSQKKQMKAIEKRTEREKEKQYLKELERKHEEELKIQQQKLFEEERRALHEEEELLRQLRNTSTCQKYEQIKNAYKEISNDIIIEAERLANEYQSNNKENPIEYQSVLEVYKMLLIPQGILEQYYSALNYQELKKEYRKSALHLHPDKNQHPQAIQSFQKVNRIYENIKSQIKYQRW